MRAVTGLVLVLGMALAGFAVFIVNGYLSDQQAALLTERARSAQIVETVEVLAVNKALAFGASLTTDDIITVKYAKEFLPEGSFATKEDLFSEGDDVTRSVLRPMEPNEIVLLSKLTAPGEIASITQELRPKMRAFTIRVDASTGVSGFLRPGDRVDIYWTGSVQGDAQFPATSLIGSSIELVAIDQSTDKNRVDTSIPSTVTVQVIPEDVARLAQAQSEGKLSLALVGNDSAANAVPDGESAITLPAAPAAPMQLAELPTPAPAEAPAQCFTTVRRGTEKVQMEIACTN